MQDALDVVKNFADLFAQLEARWQFLYNEIHLSNLKQCDLLHKMESEDEDGYATFLELQGLRRYRRFLKNEQFVTRQLRNWKNEGADLNKLDAVMLRIERLRRDQENWTYHARYTEKEAS